MKKCNRYIVKKCFININKNSLKLINTNGSTKYFIGFLKSKLLLKV